LRAKRVFVTALDGGEALIAGWIPSQLRRENDRRPVVEEDYISQGKVSEGARLIFLNFDPERGTGIRGGIALIQAAAGARARAPPSCDRVDERNRG